MKIREYIDKIGENRKQEDMEELGDMLAELIYMTKESHHDIYEKYKMKLYTMAYGKVLTKEMAEEIVNNMLPYGEYWDMETTNSVKSQFGVKNISDIDFYVVMNKTYNDNKDTVERFAQDETQQIQMYISLTNDFVNDIDAKEGKVFTYFMQIPK